MTCHRYVCVLGPRHACSAPKKGLECLKEVGEPIGNFPEGSCLSLNFGDLVGAEVPGGAESTSHACL